MNTEVLYSVTWHDKPYGPAWTLDGYDKDEIHDIAIKLAKAGNDVEPLQGPIEVNLTKAEIEAMERGREKLLHRSISDLRIQLVQERLAHKQEKLDDCANCTLMFNSEPTKEMVR